MEFQGIRDGAVGSARAARSSSRPTSTSSCRCSTATASATGSPIGSSKSETRCWFDSSGAGHPGSVSGRAASCRQPAGRAAEGGGHQRRHGRDQGRLDRVVPQGRRGGGTRRGISEIVKWVNYVTGNRFLTAAADLSESINLEHGSLWGHYDPETNVLGTLSRRLFRKPATCRRRSASSVRTRRSIPTSSLVSGRSAAPTARSRR